MTAPCSHLQITAFVSHPFAIWEANTYNVQQSLNNILQAGSQAIMGQWKWSLQPNKWKKMWLLSTPHISKATAYFDINGKAKQYIKHVQGQDMGKNKAKVS